MTDKDSKETAVETEEVSQVEKNAAEALSPIEAELMATREQLTKSNNEYLYLRAEYDNYRRQSIKERSELIKFGGERLAKDLLETLDIFDSALSLEATPETLKNFVSGIELTAQQMRSTLQKHNIVEAPALGEAFDPALHEALGSEPNDQIKEGHVARVFKKAYKYHDKVLRPAQVIVARAKDT